VGSVGYSPSSWARPHLPGSVLSLVGEFGIIKIVWVWLSVDLPLCGLILLWLRVLLLLVVPLSTGCVFFTSTWETSVWIAAGRPLPCGCTLRCREGIFIEMGLLSSSKQTTNDLYMSRPFYQLVWQFEGDSDGCACEVRVQLPTTDFLIDSERYSTHFNCNTFSHYYLIKVSLRMTIWLLRM
jgi:hypothetical protein